MREKTVNAAARLEIIKKRDKKYLIYHQVNVTQPYSTLNLEFQVDNATTTNLVVLVRHNKMPTLKECEFVKIIGNIEARDEDCKFIILMNKLVATLRYKLKIGSKLLNLVFYI